MRIVSSTVVRHAPISAGGCIRVNEWPSGRLVAERPVVPADPPVVDPNPRGNSRGGRGVVLVGNTIVVANYHTLEVCDHDLRPKGTFSHGNFAGIHEIMRRGERLLVASTAINAAAEVSLEAVLDTTAAAARWPAPTPTRFWWPTEEAAVCESLGVPTTLYPDKEVDNRLRHLDLHNRGHAGHLHLNAVDADGDRVHALLNKPGAILRLDDMTVVLRNPLLEGAHNLEFVEPGRALVVGTRSGLLLDCDLIRGAVRTLIDLGTTPFARQVTRGGGEREDRSWRRLLGLGHGPAKAEDSAQSLFWRGLALDDDWIFVGTSPAAILGFDRRTLAYHGVVRLGTSVREVVHGIAIAS